MNERIGVVGAGVMGAGIAQVLAVSGGQVACYDVSADALAAARKIVEDGRFGVRRAVELGKLTAEGAEGALSRLRFSASLDEVADADVIVEAIPEKLDLKIRLFRDLDRRCPNPTILASNSSGFPISALAAATDRPDRVIGWHWASPAPVMRLAEIVRSPDTSDATVATVVRLAAAAGKHPVVVKDHPTAWGYVANRVYGAMLREAQRVIDEGVATSDEVDQLMVDCFRWPSGPFGMVRGATSGWKG
jgi:3-hydroxybutyryl-CoA dehydrogenase